MKYIYHIIPNPFVGTKLIPLNEMDKESELYKGHARKYLGRESLTKQQIPILNCLWNDVVQFSAINPQLIVDELKNLNPNFQLKRLEYFKISLDEISSYDGVIFDRKSKKKGSFEISEDEVKPEASFIDDLGADSLDIVELVMAMEETSLPPSSPESLQGWPEPWRAFGLQGLPR